MHEHKKDGGRTSSPTKNTYLEKPNRGTLVDPQRLGQRVVDRDVVVLKLLPQRLFGLGLVEVSRRRVGTAQPLFQVRDGDIRGGRTSVGRRGLGVMRWALRHHAAVFPHHQHLWRALRG
jgi:hypothetical protein